MAQLLGNMAVGSTVYLNENGSPQPYLIVHQGRPSTIYSSNCNGTWLLREKIKVESTFGQVNAIFPNSSIFTYLNNTLLSNYDNDIQNIIKTINLPYTNHSTVEIVTNGVSCKIFLLAAYEVGFTSENDGNEENPVYADGTILSYFRSGGSRIAYQGSIANTWWLRTWSAYNEVTGVRTNGSIFFPNPKYENGVRPAMIMPNNLLVDDSNNITSISVPSINGLTVPSLGTVDQPLPISWNAVEISDYTVNYQLQRNYNSTGWSTVSSNLTTNSYTDTPQVGWTKVQYRVAASVEGLLGSYTTSSTIPISNPSALVISGQDQDLGTITSNIPYTVSSNTGNPISLTRTVNGAQVVTLTVSSGFAYSIPIADLPTGTGTIVITAKVLNGSETVTATRTWTYYKTPINIPSTGGIAQLTQNGQNIWPISLAECIKVPTFFGGTLDKALELIAPIVNPTIIAAGSYTGNGQYGQNNPNTLTFSSQPLMVLIYGPGTSLTISSTNTSATAYISGTTATWYSTESAEAQLNSSEVEYTYVAIAITT